MDCNEFLDFIRDVLASLLAAWIFDWMKRRGH